MEKLQSIFVVKNFSIKPAAARNNENTGHPIYDFINSFSKQQNKVRKLQFLNFLPPIVIIIFLYF